MIYFKKVYLDEREKGTLETALRCYSLKRASRLDLQSSVSDAGQDKFFLGHIGKEDLTFTRIRTSFDRYLPKIIFSLPNSPKELYCRFRLSLFSTVVVSMLCLGIIMSIGYALIGDNDIWGVAELCFILGIYVLFGALELNITQTKIKRAMSAHLLSLKKEQA